MIEANSTSAVRQPAPDGRHQRRVRRRGCYSDFINADYGHAFHVYLGVDSPPRYEREGRKFRMVRKFYYPSMTEVRGEWCDSRAEAKKSYKLALRARRSKVAQQ